VRAACSNKIRGRLTAVWINEKGRKGWHGLSHYYHFAAENVPAGFGALAVAGARLPSRLIIPWEQKWHDKWGMNEMVAKGIFTESRSIIGPSDFGALSKSGKEWFFFEQSKSIPFSRGPMAPTAHI
jgi:hypothetical protein